MIPDDSFISHYATEYDIFIPNGFCEWFLTHFEDEPFPDFYDHSCMTELLRLYYNSYLNGSLDITIPSAYERLKERHLNLKEMYAELRDQYDELAESFAAYREAYPAK